MAAAPLQDFYRVETFTARCLAFACKRDRAPSFRRPRFPRDTGGHRRPRCLSLPLDVVLKLRATRACRYLVVFTRVRNLASSFLRRFYLSREMTFSLFLFRKTVFF